MRSLHERAADHARHDDVGDHEIEALPRELLESLIAVVCGLRAMPVGVQSGHESVRERNIVIHHQHITTHDLHDFRFRLLAPQSVDFSFDPKRGTRSAPPDPKR